MTRPTRARPTRASTPVSQKMPLTPITGASSGPANIASMNDTPMVMPIVAIALVRCSSRVTSAASAMTAAEIAPLPWIARPMMINHTSFAKAAIALPRANSSRPPKITGLRPMRSESRPKGICSAAWVRP